MDPLTLLKSMGQSMGQGISLTETMASLREILTFLSPLITFIIGVTVYSLFVFKFYRFLARKRIFELKITRYEAHPEAKKFLYFMEWAFLFPIVIFFWFFIMSFLIAIISIVQGIHNILFISVAFVSVVRITSYYDEDLSKDLAKLIPFALLAIFLIDASIISWSGFFTFLDQIPLMTKDLLYYLFFMIALEFFMKLLTVGKHGTRVFYKPEELDEVEKKTEIAEDSSE